MIPLFIPIPKNASSSIRQLLINKNLLPIWNYSGHFTQSYLEARSDYYNYKSDFTFCIVRNPYSRIISIYNQVRKRQIFLKGCNNYINKRYINCLNNLTDIDTFIKYYSTIANSNDMILNYHHFMLQNSYLDSSNHIHIFKFEKLEELEYVLGFNIPMVNKSINSYNLSINSRKIIQTIYKIDFQRFDYE